MEQPAYRAYIKNGRMPIDTVVSVISLVLSLAIYGAVAYFGLIAPQKPEALQRIAELLNVEEDVASSLVSFGQFIIIAFLGITFFRILWLYYRDIGSAVSRDVKIGPEQSGDIEELYQGFVQKLGLKHPPYLTIAREMPELEVLSVPIMNRFVIRYDALTVLNGHDNEDYTYVKCVLASELAHIVLGHRNLLFFLLTYPAHIIPFYNKFYSRVQIYAADRFLMELMEPEELVRGIILHENDLDFAMGCLNFEDYFHMVFEPLPRFYRFSRFIEELASETPVPRYRIAAIQKQLAKRSRSH